MGHRTPLAALLFGAGLVLGAIGAFAPVQEFSHVFAAVITGGSGSVTGWNTAVVRTYHPGFVATAGWWGETLILAGVGILFVSRRSPAVAGWLPFGAAHGAYLLAGFDRYDDLYATADPGMSVFLFYVVVGLILTLTWFIFVGREMVAAQKGTRVDRTTDSNRRPTVS